MPNNPVTEFLLRRRSLVAKKITAVPPDPHHLEEILDCAIRVPDHSNVQPWRLFVFEGSSRQKFDEEVILPAAIKKADLSGTPLSDTLITLEKTRMQRSGTVVAVLFKAVTPHKIPLWEQQLSCGAVCTHLLIAAQSYGYAAQWVTEWPAANADVVSALDGNPDTDLIAGFIHIGTTDQPLNERKRPVKEEVVHYW